MIRATLSRPLLACSIVLTAFVGAGVMLIGVGAALVNPGTFGLGVGGMLVGYGTILCLVALFVARGHRWALGLVVASSLLHLLVLGSFISAGDHMQVIISIAVGVVVLVTFISALVAIARHDMES